MKKKVLVIFGGKSGEHEVSVMSARSIEQFIDRQKFEPLFLGISEQGKWNIGSTISEITDGQKVVISQKQIHLPSPEKDLAIEVVAEDKQVSQVGIDVVFPAIHGTNGEDGRLQGFLDMANLPYVGSGVLGSAMAMDKVVQKSICLQAGINITPFEWCSRKDWTNKKQEIVDKISANLQYPLFIKPANLGSSVGISKVKSPKDLNYAVEQAFRFEVILGFELEQRLEQTWERQTTLEQKLG